MSSIFNEKNFSEVFMKMINESVAAECEPIIKDAVAKFEMKLREKLAQSIVAAIDTHYQYERMGNIVSIRVSLPDKKQ